VVKGLNRFRDHFAPFKDHYVLIGGTACDLLMTEAGLAFRATHDLDIVLCVEALDRKFAKAFWAFVRSGAYERQEASTSAKRLYRFQKPRNDAYPAMLELFTRRPDSIVISEESELTPIPIDEEVSSLSAILLDEGYYHWVLRGRVELDGVRIVRAEHMIPLKARAWIDLRARRDSGGRVDSRSISKHRNDVFRLVQIIDPQVIPDLPVPVRDDMKRFVIDVATDPPDLKSLGIKAVSFDQSIDTLGAVYGVI